MILTPTLIPVEEIDSQDQEVIIDFEKQSN